MKIKSCRVLITTECNLNCKYCCNKIPEVQNTIKFSTWPQILDKEYTNYCITGGEPFLKFDDMIALCGFIKTATRRKAKVFVYTNGMIPPSPEEVRRLKLHIDGFTIGYHGRDLETVLTTYRILSQEVGKPTRVAIQDLLYMADPSLFKDIAPSDIHLWKMNACDRDEDRYIV